MEEKNYTIAEFAEKCEVSERVICQIKNRQVQSIRTNTLEKICEAHNISYADVFDYQEELKNRKINLDNFVLTDGKDTYTLSKKV